MTKFLNSLPLFAIFSTIFINIDIGISNDSDTLKLIWLYFIVAPIIFIYLFKDKIDIQTDLISFISFAPIFLGAISAVINNKYPHFFFHDLAVGIISTIIFLYYKNIKATQNWDVLMWLIAVFPIFILIYSSIYITGLSYDSNILFGNRNLAANYLVVTMPIIGYIALYKTGFKRVLAVMALMASIASIIFYYPSRFAMVISGLILIGYFFFWVLTLSNKGKLLAIFSFTLILLFFYVNYTRYNELISFVGYDDRLVVWKIAIDAIKEKYLIGYGLGSTSQVIDNFRIHEQDYSIKMDFTEFAQLHNEPLQYLLEGGIVAFIAYVFFIILIITRIYSIFFEQDSDDKTKSISLTLFICIIVGFLHSNVDIGIKSPFNRSLLFLFIGVFLSVCVKNEK